MDSKTSYNKYQTLIEIYGADKVLNDLLLALNSKELEDNLEWLCKGYDLNINDL